MRWLISFSYDLRQAMIGLTRSPAFVFIAVPVLSLGIGVNTTVFSIIDAALLRPLPVHAPDELVSLYSHSGTMTRVGPLLGRISHPDYLDLRVQSDIFADMLAFDLFSTPLSVEQHRDRVLGQLVSANYFQTLGVRPQLGRTFLPEEDTNPGSHPVAVISHRIWQRLFHSSPEALGQTVRLNKHSFVVVGIVPPDFKGLWMPGVSAEIWIPLSMLSAIRDPATSNDRHLGSLLIVGRLRSGVRIETARAAMDIKARQLAQAYPATNKDRTFRLLPTNSIRTFSDPMVDMVPSLISVALMSIVAIVLLTAGANTAGITMARTLTRRKDLAVRLALGAGRWRLVNQLLMESILLALLAGGFGLLLTQLLLTVAVSYLRTRLPFADVLQDAAINLHVLVFTSLACVATGILVGLLPALRICRTSLTSALSDEGIVATRRGRHHLRHWIIIPQVGFCLLLLLLAGFSCRRLIRLEVMGPGFDVNNTLMLKVELPSDKYTEAVGADLYRRLLERARSLPGAAAASLVEAVPLSPEGFGTYEISPEPRRSEPSHIMYCTRISSGYFGVTRIPLIHGRDFQPRDGHVAILSQQAARTLWPTDNALGKQLRLVGFGNQQQFLEVVGISKDVLLSPSDLRRKSIIYLPFENNYHPRMHLLVHGSGPLSDRLRTLPSDLDQNIVASEIRTVHENIDITLFPLRISAAMLLIGGFFGLILATAGLYGVVSYSVGQRTREIGIRVALGAQRSDIVRLALKDGLQLTIGGSVLGLLIAIAISPMLSRLSFGLVQLDIPMLVAVPILLGLVVSLACFIPARRATRIDPMDALREL